MAGEQLDQWSEERAAELAGAALAAVGITDARTSSVKFRDPFASLRVENPPLLIKVAATENDGAILERSFKIGKFLHEGDVPVTAPAVELALEPIRVDGHSAGLWHWAPSRPGRPDPGATGRGLRALHETLADYPEPVRELDPIRPTRRRLDLIRESRALPPASIDLLAARLDLLGDAWDRFESRLGVGPLHGDFKISNLLATPEGPLIMDLDNVRVGPLEWDLATISRGAHDGWSSEEWTAFSGGYGHDLRSDREADPLCELAHLGALIFQLLPSSPEHRLVRGQALLDEWLREPEKRCHELDWDGVFGPHWDPPATQT
jgi:Phosphotransferase enzyme family